MSGLGVLGARLVASLEAKGVGPRDEREWGLLLNRLAAEGHARLACAMSDIALVQALKSAPAKQCAVGDLTELLSTLAYVDASFDLGLDQALEKAASPPTPESKP